VVTPSVSVSVCLGGTGNGYQLLTPAFYDQSGQLVTMGNSRPMAQMVRLMSPAALLMNSQQQHGPF